MSRRVDRGHLNHGRVLRLSASRYRDQPCLEFEGNTITFGELNRQVNQVARTLAERGVVRGTRVMILAANSPDYVRVMFAAAKLGAICVPCNTALLPQDLAFVITAARPALILADRTYHERAVAAVSHVEQRPLPDVVRMPGKGVAGDALRFDHLDDADLPEDDLRDDDPAVYLFTSGSMGTPKAVVKSFANLAWHAINRQISQPRHEGDRELFVLPLSGVGFGNFLVTDVMTGTLCVLEPSFDPVRAARLLRETVVTHVFMAPTMMMAIDAAVEDATFPDVRVVETAYEVTGPQRQRIAEMFPRAQILYSYGCTEGSMARAPADAFLEDPSCVGFASGLDEYRVVPTEDADSHLGAIEVTGPTVMQGYLTGPGQSPSAAVGDDGWFDTGDLGRFDQGGRLHFGGRQKDMIKSGAVNVYAWDVEAGLASHPAVHQVAVIGVADDYWGEAVAAVIEPRAGHQITLEEIRAHATQNLAGFRRPKTYFLVDRMPLNATGKIAKGELRDLVLTREILPLTATSAAPSDGSEAAAR